jgi:hypothetical protein
MFPSEEEAFYLQNCTWLEWFTYHVRKSPLETLLSVSLALIVTCYSVMGFIAYLITLIGFTLSLVWLLFASIAPVALLLITAFIYGRISK